MQSLMHRLRRIRHSIASSGLRRTVADLTIQALSYTAAQDASFDRKYGTDTSGSVQPDELGIDDPELRDKAILYLASPPRVTRWMLGHTGIESAAFSFVDLGCGKGRVILLASELSFLRVVGVEISAELCAVARRNATLYRPASRTKIEVFNADATQFEFPDTDLLIHMYHPFDPALTVRVFERLGHSLREKPRRVVVAYLVYTAAVPAVEAAFARIPWLRRTRYEHSVTGQYDWLFYANDSDARR
ncbi:MAG TPA: class I SAM-dependent methyltransferase [Steroidobacteraceae bacterium]|nr:class I SAM-dependent methyltransferase [Steroidobacteraceae bacterium]